MPDEQSGARRGMLPPEAMAGGEEAVGPIPGSRSELKALIGRVFPHPEGAGLNWREVDLPHAPPATLIWLEGLIDPTDLQGLALDPVAAGLPDVSPADVARTGALTAPRLDPIEDLDRLLAGLLEGCASLHLEGRPGALLIGPGPRPASPGPFTASLADNAAALRRHLRYAETRLEPVQDAQGKAGLVVYLEGAPAPGLAAAVRAHACRRGLAAGRRRSLTPASLAVRDPARAAALLRQGYVAVLTEGEAAARIAPVTLHLLARVSLAVPGTAALMLAGAAALGPFGFALSLFLLLAGLGAATTCGHPVRRRPAGVRA